MAKTTIDGSMVIGSLDFPSSDVASGTTTDIGASAGNVVRITGTTTITSFGAEVSKLRFVHFAGILTLTHHGTTLILPGAANITTAAGDSLIAISDASGNWRVINYQYAAKNDVGLDFSSITDVASAGTVDLGAQARDILRITGTTGITSFGAGANKLKILHFAGALTITHHGTTLILPTAANITTAAGDSLIAISDASGNWRVINYQRASGSALVDVSGSAETWARKTSAYTAVSGDNILADTVATAAFTITLPASPSGGDNVTIVPSSSYATNNLTIGRNSQTIMGDAADLVLSTTHAIKLIFDGTDSDWRVM